MNKTMLQYLRTGVIIGVCFLFASSTLWGNDWTQWRGPNRDGKSAETGLLKKWPEQGPELLVTIEGIGKGYSSPTVTGGKIYVTGMTNKKMEFLSAYDLQGNLKWKTEYGLAWTQSFPDTRTTPTVDGDYVYVISGHGKTVCFDKETGSIRWEVDLHKQFEIDYGIWGISESPLIVDNKIIVTPVGKKTTVVALDKLTGKVIWASKSLNDKAAYTSPLLIRENGKKLIAQVTGSYIIGVNPDNGDILWTHNYAQYDTSSVGGTQINPNTPLYHDHMLYVTSGYNHAGIMFNLSDDLSRAELAWIDYTLDVHHGGVVHVDGYIYGANWLSNREGNWACIEWKTGKTLYETSWNKTKGSIIYADGMLYCFEEKRGTIALVECSPEGFQIVSSFRIPKGDGPSWAHPVICDGKLYVRRGDALMVYNIKMTA